MRLKSPKDPIVLTEEDCDWLEDLMAKNSRRKTLNAKEKELLEGAKKLEPMLKEMIDEG